MPLTLKVLTGAFASKTFEFDEKKTPRVRVGRAVDAEVSWPQEEPIVGREHFELRYEAGAWKFVVSPHHRVFVGGRDAYQGMTLEDEATVQLGAHDGPTLSLRHSRAVDTNAAPTPAQGRSIDDRGLIDRARANIGAVAAVVAVISGLGGYLIHGLSASVAGVQNALAAATMSVGALQQQQQNVEKNLAAVAADANFADVFERAKPSIFLVDIVGPGNVSKSGATAWVVRLKDGQKAFATNGHVGEAFESRVKGNTSGLRMVVRSPEPGHKEYEITSQITHPGYKEFTAKSLELDRKMKGGEIRDLGTMIGYDVALLIPASQDGLPDPLPLASETEIGALRAGSTLGMSGYPKENVSTTDRMEPTPETQKGIVTAMTSFFLTPAGADAQLVQHNLPATGGSSGSPMFNSAGRVVALLNAGNITTAGDGDRTPSAILVNFAQRVDLLRELIDGAADARMASYRQAWDDTELKVKRPVRDIVEAEVHAFKLMHAGAQAAGEADGTIDTPNPAYDGHLAAARELDIEAGYRYLIFATSEDKGAKLTTILYDDTSTGYIDMNEAGAPIARLQFDAPKSQKGSLAIVSAATDDDGKPSQTPVKFKVIVWRAKN